MALTDKLRNLDQRLLPGTRDDGEDAETYLRRVAAGRAISPAQAGDVMAALRVYFDVQPDAAGDDEGQDDSAGDEKDEAEGADSEGAESEGADSEGDESDGEQSDEKSDDES